MSKIKKMCKIKKLKDNKEEILEQVKSPTHICKKCLRVSADEKLLCSGKKIKKL
ncbi:MAG: hypothetical protein ACQEQ4_06090 [Fibrobacterota bacterium]